MYDNSNNSSFRLADIKQQIQNSSAYQTAIALQQSIRQIIDWMPPNSARDRDKYRIPKAIILFALLTALLVSLSLSLLPLFSISLTTIALLAIVATIANKRKKSTLEKTQFASTKEDERPLLIKNISLKDNRWFVETIYPQLDRNNSYQLQWIEAIYPLDAVTIPRENQFNCKIWQEMGSLQQKFEKITAEIAKYRLQIQTLQDKKTIAATSELFVKRLPEYDLLIVKMEGSINTGMKLQEDIAKLIRDYLIGMEIGEADSIEIINEIEAYKQESKEVGVNLEDKYNSLRLELNSYLDTISEYSQLIESVDRVR